MGLVLDEKGLARFMDKVRVDDATGCWLWTAYCCGRGAHKYGVLTFKNVRTFAHRLSYETFVGQIPPKMVVCHKCDVPNCVNPAHLFVGTQKDNMVDCKQKRRFNHRQGVCHANHKLTEEQVLDIYNSKKSGAGTSAMARKYNVTPSVVVSIMNGRSWKWLTNTEGRNLV